ncbi:hypothetical protein GWR56_13545 [Mucilaginibacter sp. 14171R-50]|uniref:DUF5977 domain-containing protein n=1 Tax=Mucilaginibacter sp. 14171R-50 TaxID=2703789 RepID=UPI00138BC1CC|nr:DUF5977 domain-containing protein [Mucilaginibacter sp. 14171R-50]QHS56512.1 hypothetical protein GWR56_13545 [Mucilaginibacter sp. 14171R-50]
MNSVASPSANAASALNSSQNYKVNLYSGQLQYEAAITKLKFAGIDIPISVSYKASGVKVQELQSITGTSWKLNAGGLIGRYVQGLPDEHANGYCGANRIGGNNYVAATTTYAVNAINNDNTKTTWDTEPDQFFFSFLNFSGIFMLDPDGRPVLKSSYGLKIIYSPFDRTTGRAAGGQEQWIIKDRQGNSYYFGSGATETSVVTNKGQNAVNAFTKTFISGWYLSKIITTDNQIINFSYQSTSGQSYTNYLNVVMYYVENNQTKSKAYNEDSDVSISAPLSLKSITYSIFEVNFNFDNSPALYEIELKQKGKTEYIYHFNYTGFFPSYRLLLSSIERQDIVTTERHYMYGFTYNSQVSLPERNSIQTDYWGYYNSNPGTSNVEGYGGSNKSPDPVRTQANILLSATNEFGGTDKFTYEQNVVGQSQVVGGVRIKNVTSYGENNAVVSSQTYDYTDPSTGYSSGQSFNGSGLEWFYAAPAMYYFSESITAVADLAGLSVGYSWVKVTNADGSASRYHYTNYSDYPDVGNETRYNINDHSSTTIDPISDIYSPNFPKTSFSFARGQILSKEEINADQKTVSEVTNTYSMSAATGDVVWKKVYPWSGIPFLPSVQLYAIHRSDFQQQDLLLTSQTQTNNFFINQTANGSSTTGITYTYTSYNGESFISSETKTLSNGNVEKTVYRYPFSVLTTIPSVGVTTSSPLSFMVQNNRIGDIVETTKTITKAGIEYLTSAVLNRYTAAGPGVKLTATYRLRNQGILKSNYIFYTVTPGGGSETETIDNTNLEPVQVIDYDAWGNPLSTKNAFSNIQTSNLYGYDKNYTVAKVVNAKPNEIFYDGMEEAGSWAGVTYDNTFSHSGQYSAKIVNTGSNEIYQHSNITLSVALAVPKKFKYSGWVYSTQPSAEIFLFMKRAGETGYYSYVDNVITTVTNKWVYLEKTFLVPADVTQLNLRVDNNGAPGGGTVWFDDLRLYPADALMSTYNYEPLVGLTGSGDEKGQTVSYEYDNYRRLVVERDLNGFITKTYTYHKRIFSNAAISQTYEKQGCPVNTTPSQIPYNVAANAYTSTLSQQDADDKAAADQKSNGQNNANVNGTCTPVSVPVSFNLVNHTGLSGYVVTFSGSGYTSFSFNANSTMKTVSVNSGTYSVSVAPVGSYTVQRVFDLTGKAAQYGPGTTFTNVIISPGNILTLSITPY